MFDNTMFCDWSIADCIRHNGRNRYDRSKDTTPTDLAVYYAGHVKERKENEEEEKQNEKFN